MKRSILSVLFLGGCASLSTQLPPIDAQTLESEQTYQVKQAFAEMAQLRERLSTISSPILKANTELCEKTGPDFGAVTHTLKSYPKKLRDAAKREIGVGNEPRILYVRAGSPAARAGIAVGDRLETDRGKALSARSKTLHKLIEAGKPIVRVRNDVKTPVTIPYEPQCDYALRLKMTSTINAYATGGSIIMTAGMMDFVKSDAELAAIIGHELAHNELSHIRKILTNLVLTVYGTRYTREFESEADYVGLYYTARAGYKIDDVGTMWRRLGKLVVRPIVRPKTHPTFPDRYVRLAAARDEIKAKQLAGKPLIPNFKDARDP